MISIWKYDLQTTGKQTIRMPAGAEILTVQTQKGEPRLWARVDTNSPEEDRVIITRGTGHPLSTEAEKYISTYKLSGDNLVFHVFESL